LIGNAALVKTIELDAIWVTVPLIFRLCYQKEKIPHLRDFSCSWFRLNILNLNLNLISKEGWLSFVKSENRRKSFVKKILFFPGCPLRETCSLIGNITYFRHHVGSL
jgi:hypothetical protein